MQGRGQPTSRRRLVWKSHSDGIRSNKQGLKLCLGELRSFVKEGAFDLGLEGWIGVHLLEETREAW